MLYLFENFTLDTQRRELRRSGNLLSVEPKVFDLLAYLVENCERVVSRDDLLSSIWDGRIVSESALTTCINAARSAVSDSGEEQRLIKTLPRKGVRFVGALQLIREPAPVSAEKTVNSSLKLPDKPSIAVLPFANMSSDSDQDYLTDGIVEEITTALSRINLLFVISRNSSFTFKGVAVDAKRVGHELGVRYVLEGSVRKAQNRIRVTGRLVDASAGVHLWADRFDGGIEDIFDLQDQVTSSVVGSILPKIERAEIERAIHRPTESLDAYDYYLRGLANLYQWSRQGNDEALKLFHRAIERDPGFAAAYGMAAWCHDLRKWNGWVSDHAQAITETERLASQAALLGKDDAVALYTAGFALAHVVGDLSRGAALIDRSLALNTNLAGAWNASGWVRTFLAETDLAIEHLVRGMRLSPLDPLMYLMQSAMALAHFVAGRYLDASAWAERAVRDQPTSLATLRIFAASCMLSGRLEEAQKAMDAARQLDPDSRISNLKDRVGRFRAEDFKKYADALRLAGLPD